LAKYRKPQVRVYRVDFHVKILGERPLKQHIVIDAPNKRKAEQKARHLITLGMPREYKVSRLEVKPQPMQRQLTLTRSIYPVKNLPQDTRNVLKLMKGKIKRVETCPICFERSLYVFRGPNASVRVCANPKCEAFGFMNNVPDVKPSDIKKVK